MPSLTVFIPAYNAGPWIEQTLQSVLTQTYGDFSVLIIDDGSTDDTVAKVRGFADARIKLVQSPKNQGIARTRNLALTLCETPWLACLDADDIAAPARLALQMAYLELHPDTVVLGGMGEYFGNMTGRASYPIGEEAVQARLPFDNPFMQNTVVLNVSWLRDKGIWYREEYQYCEDYDFWAQIGEAGGRMTNLAEVLVHYRVHDASTSRSKRRQQEQLANQVRQRLLAAKGCMLTREEQSFLDNFQFEGSFWPSRATTKLIRTLASRLRSSQRFYAFEIGRFICSAMPRPESLREKVFLALFLLRCLPNEGPLFLRSYLTGRG